MKTNEMMICGHLCIVPQTWLCLSAVIALIGPVLYITNFVSPYHEFHSVTKKGGLFKFGNCFWYIYGALLQQGNEQYTQNDDSCHC